MRNTSIFSRLESTDLELTMKTEAFVLLHGSPVNRFSFFIYLFLPRRLIASILEELVSQG